MTVPVPEEKSILQQIADVPVETTKSFLKTVGLAPKEGYVEKTAARKASANPNLGMSA